jgi:diguanylate cyclase (GGDEF)-like protein
LNKHPLSLFPPPEPLPDALRAALLPWLLLAAMVIAGVELQRHWGSGVTGLYVANLILIIAAWAGMMISGKRFAPLAGPAVDLIIFSQLASGVALMQFGDPAAGAELLRELAFWAPLVCVWWGIYYHGQPVRLLVPIVLLYGGLLATGRLDPTGHGPLEFLVQGAMAVALSTLLLNAMRQYHRQVEPTPAAVDAAMHDQTTGSASRGYFEAEMAHTAAIADRYGHPYSLMMAVLDDFDRVPEGQRQEVLRDFAWLVIDRLRHADTLCRWQGEKFIAILPDTSLAAARSVADSVRAMLATTRLGGIDGVTATIGVCQHQLGEDPMATFEAAEQALGRTRQHGSDQVAVAA